MSVITRSLVVIIAVFAAMQTAIAQQPPEDGVRIVSTRDQCPVEPHPKAINPDVVLCHARFAPLPVMPREIERGNEKHLEILRTRGDDLLRQLDRPETCGRSVKVRMQEACAILIYVLDEEYRQARLPWTYIVKIYRTSRAEGAPLRETVVFTVRSNNTEGRYGSGAIDGEVWQLLADQRVETRCKPGMSEFLRDSNSASADPKFKRDSCRRVGQDVRYRPALLLGRGEAERMLTHAAIRRHFGPAD